MERERPRITIDASELEQGFDRFLKLADAGAEVIITEQGRVTARLLSNGPPRRRRPTARITPRRRQGPRYIPPLVGVDLSNEDIDRITRESR